MANTGAITAAITPPEITNAVALGINSDDKRSDAAKR